MKSPEQNNADFDPISLEREASVEASRLFNEFLKDEYGIKEALALLDTLDPKYVYHSKKHTLDVIYETILFAVIDGAPENVIRQEAISAAWHDTGFIQGCPAGMTSEQYAMHLFRESVTYERLIKNGDDGVANNILANIEDTEVRTEIRGVPSLKKLHENTPGFVLDGDVSNFGRSDFFEKLELVGAELGYDMLNPEVRRRFYAYVLTLMKNHSWRTGAAHTLRETQKKKNMETITRMLGEMQ